MPAKANKAKGIGPQHTKHNKGINMLKLDKVSKFYSQNGVVTAGFSKVSLDLNIGEFVAITGESGSGKSTLLNVISGLDSYEEGEMYIFGQPTSGYGSADMEEYRKRYIGNIFQTFNLINHYTVYQNVELVLLLSGFEKSEIKERVDSIIDRVGLSEYRNTKASKLSGGQKQRVAIARALAKETPIIVADEPTGNLDVASAADIIKLLASLSKDKLIIIVTHNYEQVEPYVTRKISMHDGRIAEDKRVNSPAEVSMVPGTTDTTIRPKEARHDALSKGNTVRLGARNAFSLPAKFLLLLFVFIFLTAGTFASYSAYIGMRESSSNNSWGYIFDNVSPTRVVVTKNDESILTDSDIAEIKAIDNIAYVEHYDLLMDYTFTLTDDSSLSSYAGYYDEEYYYKDEDEYMEVSYWVSLKIAGLDFLGTTELAEGRLPKNENEAVLMLEKGSWLDENKREEIMGKTSYLEANAVGLPADGLNLPVDIVGVAYFKDDSWQTTQMSWCEGFLIMNEEGCNRMETVNTCVSSLIEMRAGDNILSVGYSYYDDVWLVADEDVMRGTVKIPEFMEDLERYKVSLRVRKSSFDREKEFKVAEVLKDDDRVHMNPNDIWSFYAPADRRQVSVVLESEFYQAETRATLEEFGYKTLYLNKTTDRQNQLEKVLTAAMRVIVLVFLLAVLFFIIYFITKLIMKSQNVYYSTVRMLGGSQNACSGTLLAELLVIFHIAFIICLAIMIKITLAGSKILSPYAVRMIRYIRPGDYVILYIVVLVMTLLLAYRYSSQMFKKTAMNAYREEV